MLRWQHYTIYLELLIPTCSKHLYFSQKHSGVIEHDVMFELKRGKKHLSPSIITHKFEFVCYHDILGENEIWANSTLAMLISDNLSLIHWEKKASCEIHHHFFPCTKASWDRKKDGKELEALENLSVNCTTVEEKSTVSHTHDPVLMVGILISFQMRQCM